MWNKIKATAGDHAELMKLHVRWLVCEAHGLIEIKKFGKVTKFKRHELYVSCS